MGGGGGEVQYSCKGKLNEKSPCNPKKTFMDRPTKGTNSCSSGISSLMDIPSTLFVAPRFPVAIDN